MQVLSKYIFMHSYLVVYFDFTHFRSPFGQPFEQPVHKTRATCLKHNINQKVTLIIGSKVNLSLEAFNLPAKRACG